MKNIISRLRTLMFIVLTVSIPQYLIAEETSSRQIDEVIVTAERKEASIQDTSISITAFTGDMLEDLGIRNQSDLQNMVPATTIQPYDSAVRGVGRNFRNLGGDPGVATYMNGIYSEDLYTATIGSFWDIDRIEILRGPQGTLYGRNAVGGAMNFHYKKPTEELDFSVKTIVGDYGTKDYYGVVNVPLIDQKLAMRLTGSSREHDGWVEEKSGLGPDLDSGNETNFSLSILWNINEDMTFSLRHNKADVDRVMGGANGAGLVMLSGEFPDGTTRDNVNVTNDLRAVNFAEADPLSSAYVMPGMEIFSFTNPTTGAEILAQRDRVGVDPSNFLQNPGQSSGSSNTDCLFLDRENIKGSDLCAYTNGLNSELFDQQGTQVEFSWDISDSMTFKYLVGYNDLMYERTTDDDSFSSTVHDRQFYVNHEAEYLSHEFQLFWDVGDNLTFTSGIFSYDSTIDQRYDFYSSTSQSNISDISYVLDPILATVAPGFIPGDPALTFLVGPAVDVRSARKAAEAAGTAVGQMTTVVGFWGGDATLGSVAHGPVTPGSDLHALNKTERKAKAVYTQGVWTMSDQLTLTAGVRWAEDKINGTEDLARFAETETGFWKIPDDPFYGALNLFLANVIRGAINPATLQPTGLVEPWKAGVPFTLGLYREVERTDSKVTWRVNIDYDITDDMMLYGNVTTGYRSGGFNLAFFSQTPQYEPEELTAYEFGVKGQFLDNILQMNASLYFYDYESIHTFTTEACPLAEPVGGFQSACGVATTTSSVQAAPGAEVIGFEIEAMWLATDNLTLGGNYSMTDSEYTESFLVTDGADPTIPTGIYSDLNKADRARDVKGNKLQQVPDSKFSLFGSYNLSMGGSGAINFLVNYSWIDDVYFSAFETELDKAPAYARVDLRATWTSPGTNWIVSAFVNNVEDEIGIRYIERHNNDDGYRRNGQVTEPRLYGLELTYNLNGQ